MWLLSNYARARFQICAVNGSSFIFYSRLFAYTLAPWFYKKKGDFVYVDRRPCAVVKSIGVEVRNVRFRYAGKAYRISKRGRVLVLSLHYPTFKYVLRSNVKLYHRKKKKKLFKLKILTNANWKRNLFSNMFRLRVPDTYTRRGILNNVFLYDKRKQRMATRR